LADIFPANGFFILGMLIEQPPAIYRLLFPNAKWLLPVEGKKVVYLTFDDGPVPEITPWVLEILRKYNIKATFFCVGDNIRKHPEIYQMLLKEGHKTGNHTFNHIQGIKTRTNEFVSNTQKQQLLMDTDLFRPPHGHMRIHQLIELQRLGFKIIMWDVVTRDYNSKKSPEEIFNNVKRYTRNGSIIVFHDSLKAEKNLRYALPKSIEWLIKEGYSFCLLHGKKI